MPHIDSFDRIFGDDVERAARYREAYSRHWPDDNTLFVGIADVLNDRTAWEYAPRGGIALSETDLVRETLYPRDDVQAFVEAWAAAGFFRDIRWTLCAWYSKAQPIGPVIEAIPVVYRMLMSGHNVQRVCVAWNEGGFWAMEAESQGVHPELAGALG